MSSGRLLVLAALLLVPAAAPPVIATAVRRAAIADSVEALRTMKAREFVVGSHAIWRIASRQVLDISKRVPLGLQNYPIPKRRGLWPGGFEVMRPGACA